MATPTQTERATNVRTAHGSRLVLHGIAVALLSAYPLSLILRANLGVVPIGASSMLWVLAVDVMMAGALFLALRVATSDVGARASWLGVFFLLFGIYAVVLQLTNALGWPLLPERPRVAIGYTVIIAAIATVAVRPWKIRTRDPIPLLIVGIVLVGTNTAVGVSRAVTFSSVSADEGGGWQPAAARLIDQATSGPTGTATRASRDIYYIVMDGFGRADTLGRVYDLDLGDFVAFLNARGFYVASQAQSNYGQTYLSLAATLNLGYLNDVAAAMGRGNSDRTPLSYLIDHNALMTLAKRAGYQVVGIGSDYMATEYLAAADVCQCEQFGSSETEQAVFASTPLMAIALGPRAFNAHRRKVLRAFDDLEQGSGPGTRSFVFAHILAPHPPFVFMPDGNAPEAEGLFMFQDGSHYQGSREEYRQGYRNQAQFVIRRLETVIDSLLDRPGPRPVIVIHGDHGPGLGLDWTSAKRTDMAERMSIFAAYLFPDGREQPYAAITPVNGARLLANDYLGTTLPRLEDKSFFSTWERPFDFLPVSASTVSTND